MVPSAFLRLDAFAFTPNGKIDRRALLAPDSDAFVLQNYEAPQGDFEAALAALWAELLSVRRIGVTMISSHSVGICCWPYK